MTDDSIVFTAHDGSRSVIGREDEIARLNRAIARPGGGAILVGPASIGLTALLSQIHHQADPTDVDVIAIGGSRHTAGSELAAFAAFMSPSVTPEASAHERADTVLTSLRSRAGPRRILLLIDDADQLDDASIELACRLLESGLGSVIAAFHVSSAAMAGYERAKRSGSVDLVEPRALTCAEVDRIVSERLSGPLAAPTAARIQAMTAGRPGLIEPVVSDALAANALRLHRDVWLLERHCFALPSVGRLVQAQLAEASPGVRDVVRHACLAEYVPLSVLEELTGRDDVWAAEDARWIATDQAGRVRIELPAIGTGLRQTIGMAAARTMRTAQVRAWRAAGLSSPPDELPLVLLARGSDLPPSPAELSRAALVAAGQARVELAGELAASAQGGRGGPGETASRVNAPAQVSGTSTEARSALAWNASSDEGKAAGLREQVVRLLWVTGDAPAMVEAIESAASSVHSPSVVAELKATRAFAAALDWRFAEARDLLNDAMRGPSSDETTVAAGCAAVAISSMTGEVGARSPTTAEVEAALGRQPALLSSRTGWTGQLGTAGLISGSIPAVTDVIDRWIALDPAQVSPFGNALTSTLRGERALLLGQARLASHHFMEASSLLTADGSPNGRQPLGPRFGPSTVLPGAPVWRERSDARLALAHAMCGECDEAEKLMAERIGITKDPGRIVDLMGRATTYWIAAAKGDEQRAARHALADAEEFRSLGATACEALALHHAIRFGDASGQARLAEIAASLDLPRARYAALLAHGARHGDVPALIKGAAMARDEGAVLAALDMQSQAALTLLEREQWPRFWAALATAGKLRDACDVDTPRWLQLRRPLPLTARELEVAHLVADGMSSLAVASRLVVSPRTVEGHVQRAFDKLGVHDRSELRAALGLEKTADR